MTKTDKQNAFIENTLRELDKSLGVLKNVERHLKSVAIANAALHCSEEVIPSPLYGQVVMAMNGIRAVLKSYKRKTKKVQLKETEEIKVD